MPDTRDDLSSGRLRVPAGCEQLHSVSTLSFRRWGGVLNQAGRFLSSGGRLDLETDLFLPMDLQASLEKSACHVYSNDLTIVISPVGAEVVPNAESRVGTEQSSILRCRGESGSYTHCFLVPAATAEQKAHVTYYMTL